MLDPQALLNSLDPELRRRAFTHRSLCAGDVPHEETNERLEFLGDAVLELCVSEFLFANFPSEDEGLLTRYRSALVRTESLAELARDLNLGENLLMNIRGDLERDNLPDSILANTFEAVTGALYLSQGLPACHDFLNQVLLQQYERFIQSAEAKDPKTLLQEKVQALGKSAPQYDTILEEGPDHAKTFTIRVSVAGFSPSEGQGSSKQKAQQDAAEHFLQDHFAEAQ